jgi:hypothetical protein
MTLYGLLIVALRSVGAIAGVVELSEEDTGPQMDPDG